MKNLIKGLIWGTTVTISAILLGIELTYPVLSLIIIAGVADTILDLVIP